MKYRIHIEMRRTDRPDTLEMYTDMINGEAVLQIEPHKYQTDAQILNLVTSLINNGLDVSVITADGYGAVNLLQTFKWANLI